MLPLKKGFSTENILQQRVESTTTATTRCGGDDSRVLEMRYRWHTVLRHLPHGLPLQLAPSLCSTTQSPLPIPSSCQAAAPPSSPCSTLPLLFLSYVGLCACLCVYMVLLNCNSSFSLRFGQTSSCNFINNSHKCSDAAALPVIHCWCVLLFETSFPIFQTTPGGYSGGGQDKRAHRPSVCGVCVPPVALLSIIESM